MYFVRLLLKKVIEGFLQKNHILCLQNVLKPLTIMRLFVLYVF